MRDQGQKRSAGRRGRRPSLNSDAAMALSDETHGGVRQAADQEAALPPGTPPEQPRPASSLVNPGHQGQQAGLRETTGEPGPRERTNDTASWTQQADWACDEQAGDLDDSATANTQLGRDDSTAQPPRLTGEAVQQDDSMEQLKWEVAGQLGLADDLQDPDELTVREAGKVGGNMVRRLIERGKESMAKEQGDDNPGASRPTPR